MKNLVLMPLIAAALVSQAAGCIIETNGTAGDDDGGGGVATVSARWSLRNMSDGASTLCPSGYDTAQLISQAVDANNLPVGEPYVDLFDCNAKSGLSSALVPDVYQVWIELRTHDGANLYAQSLSQILDVRVANKAFTTDILNDGGYFQLSWDLVGKATNKPLDCSDVVGGIDKIESVSASVADANRAYDDKFTCEDHSGVTSGLLQGSYTITIDAARANKSIGTAPMQTSKTIRSQNRITDLGHIIIPIDGQ